MTWEWVASTHVWVLFFDLFGFVEVVCCSAFPGGRCISDC